MRHFLLALAAALPLAAAIAAAPDAALPPPRDYASACAACHANNGFAVQTLRARLGDAGALITGRDDLDDDYIRAAVRAGVGAMPPMSKAEVSDAELDAIIAELTRERAR